MVPGLTELTNTDQRHKAGLEKFRNMQMERGERGLCMS